MLPVRSITKGHGVSFISMQMITNYLYNFPQSELNTVQSCLVDIRKWLSLNFILTTAHFLNSYSTLKVVYNKGI